jgi:hypothetical protein
MLKLILFHVCIFLLILTQYSTAQNTYKLNIKTDKSTYLISPQPMENGDCLIAGYDIYNKPSTLLRFVRINKKGKTVWSKYFSVPGYHAFSACLSATKDNGFIAVARLDSTNKYGLGLEIFKSDSNGNIQWQKKFISGNNAVMYPQKIIQAKNGGYYFIHAEDDFTFLNKLDQNGNLLWFKAFDPAVTDYGYSIDALAEADDGGAMIVIGNAGCEFYCVNLSLYKFNKNGDPETTLSFLPDFYPTSYNISYLKQDTTKKFKILFKGSVLGASSGKYSYITVQPNEQRANMLTMKDDIFSFQYILRTNKILGRTDLLSQNIALEQNKYINRDLSINASYDYQDENNIHYIYTERYDSLGRICPDYTLPRIDSTVSKTHINVYQGFFQSVNTLGLSVQSSTLLSSVASTPDIICAGEAPQNISQSMSSESNGNLYGQTAIRIFPNPAHDYIMLSINSNNDNFLKSIEIIDVVGSIKRTYSGEGFMKKNLQKLELNNLPKGIYFLKVKMNTTEQVLKFIKD